MTASRRKLAFWRRTFPLAPFDISNLRPAELPRGQRFETLGDVIEESLRSQELLERRRQGGAYIAYLKDCREGHYCCEKTYCPICARTFRRYLIGELLRLHSVSTTKTWFLTILLEAAPRGELRSLRIERFRDLLRKRLNRAGLGAVIVVGAFEMIYRARTKEWVLHINLIIFEDDQQAIARFEKGFLGSSLYRPVERTPVDDPAEQLSYLSKFTTYHRPHKQNGAKKSKAVPLNPAEHFELTKWMAQFGFPDYLFLFNVRRRGTAIENGH